MQTVLISLESPAVGPLLKMLTGQEHLTFLTKIQVKSQSFLNQLFHFHIIHLPLMREVKTLQTNHMYQERFIPFRIIHFLQSQYAYLQLVDMHIFNNFLLLL